VARNCDSIKLIICLPLLLCYPNSGNLKKDEKTAGPKKNGKSRG